MLLFLLLSFVKLITFEQDGDIWSKLEFLTDSTQIFAHSLKRDVIFAFVFAEQIIWKSNWNSFDYFIEKKQKK